MKNLTGGSRIIDLGLDFSIDFAKMDGFPSLQQNCQSQFELKSFFSLFLYTILPWIGLSDCILLFSQQGAYWQDVVKTVCAATQHNLWHIPNWNFINRKPRLHLTSLAPTQKVQPYSEVHFKNFLLSSSIPYENLLLL